MKKISMQVPVPKLLISVNGENIYLWMLQNSLLREFVPLNLLISMKDLYAFDLFLFNYSMVEKWGLV